MWRLLVVFALLHLAHSNCHANFELVKDGECRGLGKRRFTTSYDQAVPDAVDICKEFEGKPMIIHDEEHQKYWWNRLPGDGVNILGLACNQKSKKWEWADGTILDYKPPKGYYNADLDKECFSGVCWQFLTNGTWTYGAGSSAINGIVFCTTQLEQPIPEDAGCDEEDEVCYPVIKEGENWQDAEATCQRFGADQASIHNKQENSYLRRQAVTTGAVNGVYIGAKADKDGKFKWVDGTEMYYENYAPGFPKKNFGDCIAMDTTSTSGQWMNIDCNTKLPVACAIKKGAEPMCTGEDYEEGAIMTSPGFPFSASTPCDYFISVPSGSSKKWIELNIIALESNSCCDFVTVHDTFLGGHQIGKLSGIAANQTFTSTSGLMRISWIPDGGVNVRGLMMTFKFV